MRTKEIEMVLIEAMDGSYALPCTVNLERTDLGHKLKARLIIELPDEKLRLSREQVLVALNIYLPADERTKRTILESLGFSK